MTNFKNKFIDTISKYKEYIKALENKIVTMEKKSAKEI